MADNNYYAWLGLSVERFESDPIKLQAAADQLMRNWTSKSNNSEKYRLAMLHEESLLTAIAQPDRWRQIYMEYKQSVDQAIIDGLIGVAQDGITVGQQYINGIAKAYGVSSGYIEDIAKANGLKIGESKPDQGMKLEAIYPGDRVKSTLANMEKNLSLLFVEDIVAFINEINENSGGITLQSGQNEIVNALNKIDNQWKKVSPTGKLANKKTAIEVVCSTMLSFLKTYTLDDYRKYVRWKGIKAIMDERIRSLKTIGIDFIQDRAFNETVDRIFAILGNRQDARSIFENYCQDKGISFTKLAPEMAVCPFCKHSFKKEKPLQPKCPSCGKAFLIKCPKCGREKHMISDGICDGIDLQLYPELFSQLEEANNYFDHLALARAEVVIHDIELQWPGFPGCDELSKKCAKAKADYQKILEQIENLCEALRYTEAKRLCTSILQVFPDAKDRFTHIFEAIDEAGMIWATYEKETNRDTKRSLLLQLTSIVSDDPRAVAAMQGYSVEPVQDLQINVNYDGGNIILQWKSDNADNSATYFIRRKTGAPVANHEDGEEITHTQGYTCSDADVPEGKALYYAVYAAIGPIISPICATSKAVFYLPKLDLSVQAGDGIISVSWEPTAPNIVVCAFYDTEPINGYEIGNKCNAVTSSGFTLDGLKNGQTYYCSVYKSVIWENTEFKSPLAVQSATPIIPISYPEISKSIGKGSGEYILTYLNPQPGVQMKLYGTELYGAKSSPNVTSRHDISLQQLEKKVKLLQFTHLGNNQYSLKLPGQHDLCVYPVLLRGDMAAVGGYQILKYVEVLNVQRHIIGGDTLTLFLEHWPNGVKCILPCCSWDGFSEHPRDCDKQCGMVYPPQSQATQPTIVIQSMQSKPYYITLFAAKGGEYIPVCNYFYDNREKPRISYRFMPGFGGMKIALENSLPDRPMLHFVVKQGSVPLRIADGVKVYTIPEMKNVPKDETIPVRGFRPAKNMYGRLFADTKDIQVVLKGNDCLK